MISSSLGSDLDNMDDSELQNRIKTVNIFARVVPEQKLRLVNAFKANGEIVAMTGDGVNDAPALKSAHIGIAMGGRGTDVARESSALVLLDDDFSSIVQAVKMGRRIFDNIKKAIAYIFAIHVPIAGMSLIPVLLQWPLVLLPVHVVFLELIIDPACSVVFEAESEEADVMSRPPRNPQRVPFQQEDSGHESSAGYKCVTHCLGCFRYCSVPRPGGTRSPCLDLYHVDHRQPGFDPDKSFVVSHHSEHLTFPEHGLMVGIRGRDGLSGSGALYSLPSQPVPFIHITLCRPVDLFVCRGGQHPMVRGT